MHQTQRLFFDEENGSDWLRVKKAKEQKREQVLVARLPAFPVNPA
jgi:hypothetical protein